MMDLNERQEIALEWFFLAFSGVFVLARFYSRRVVQGVFTAADSIVVITWFIFLGYIILDTSYYHYGFSDPNLSVDPSSPNFFYTVLSETQIRLYFKFIYMSFPFYGTVLYGVKLSLLLLYFGIIPPAPSRWRTVLKIVAGIVLASYIISMFLNLFWCRPIISNWSLDPNVLCVSSSSTVPFYTTFGLHVATDIILFLIPFFLIRFISLSRPLKVGAAIMIVLGALCIAATIARTVSQIQNVQFLIVSMWIALEPAVGIIIVCIPGFKALIDRRRNPIHDSSSSRRRLNAPVTTESRIRSWLSRQQHSGPRISRVGPAVTSTRRNDGVLDDFGMMDVEKGNRDSTNRTGTGYSST